MLIRPLDKNDIGIAMLIGLFTDRATKKLKGIVDVIFSSKEQDNLERNDPAA